MATIIFKVSDELDTKIKAVIADKKINMTDFMRGLVDDYFKPKFLVDTATGEVTPIRGERTIDLYQKVYAELLKTKLDEVSLTDHVNAWIWTKIENAKKYFEDTRNRQQASTIRNASSQNGDTGGVQESRFDYWDKRIAACGEYEYEEQDEIRSGITNETGITEPQRKLLLNGGTRRKRGQ